MGYRETTNYLGGLEGETGLEPYNGGPQFAPLVDRLIGNAFVMVKVVAQHLNLIKYVAFNMEAVVTVAQNLSAIETAATAETAIAAASTSATTAAATATAAASTAVSANTATALLASNVSGLLGAANLTNFYVGNPTTTAEATLSFKSSGNSNAFDAQIYAQGGGIHGWNGNADLYHVAGSHYFQDDQLSTNFSVGQIPSSLEYWTALGGQLNVGPTLLATGPNAYTDGSLTAGGRGDLWFNNALGAMLHLTDGGAGSGSVPVVITPGYSSLNSSPVISSIGTITLASPYTVGLQGSGALLNVSNSLTLQDTTTATPSTQFAVFPTPNAANYISLRSGLTGSGPELAVNGSDANIDISIGAQGTGVMRLYPTWIYVGGYSGGISTIQANGTSALQVNGSSGQPTYIGASPGESEAYPSGSPVVFMNAQSDASASFQTPVTGFSIAMAGGSLILKGAATLAAGTITLPQSALNGQVASISSDITVTALAIAGGTGVTVNGAPTTIAANSGIAFTYELATKIWHRRQ